MLTELFFVALLDLSLPEFQPEVDISGNVIVSEYDVSTGDVSAAEIPIDDIVIKEDVPEGLSLGTSERSVIINNYNLRSVDSSSNVITVPTSSIMLTISNGVISAVGYSQGAQSTYTYVELQPGITYTFDTDAPRVNLTTGFTVNNTYVGYTDSTYTPTQIMYVFVWEERYLTVTYVESSNDEPTVNIDLSNIELMLADIIDIKRSIRLIVLFIFIYPLAMSCLRSIGGKKDV